MYYFSCNLFILNIFELYSLCFADFSMAELDIGQHCSYASCQQLDFLPFTCDRCQKVFCKEHRSPDSHNCTECTTPVTLAGARRGPSSYECSLSECSNREMLDIVCDACKKRFCLQHRHAGDHRCQVPPPNQPTVERMARTAQHVENILKSKAEAPVRKPRGRKSKATADKVSLMKLKMAAIGDKHTPESDRIYFRVVLPLGSAEKSKAFFFSKIWTVGRAIDKCASLVGIQNDNNVATAKKLLLFAYEDGSSLRAEVTLENLLQDEEVKVCNGSTLILEYVADGTVTLEQLQAYQIK